MMKDKINYKKLARIDPTYEPTVMDMKINQIFYYKLIAYAELDKKIFKLDTEFFYERYNAYFSALLRTYYFKKRYSLEKIIQMELHKDLKKCLLMIRIFLKQFRIYLTNVLFRHLYNPILYYWRYMCIYIDFFKVNRTLFFLDIPRAYCISSTTIRDEKMKKCIIFLECVFIITFSLYQMNPSTNTISDQKIVDQMVINQRKTLHSNQKDCLPFVLKQNPITNIILDRKPYIINQKPIDSYSTKIKIIRSYFRRSLKKSLFALKQKQSSLKTKDNEKISSVNVELIKQNQIKKKKLFKALKHINFKKITQKRVVGYKFPYLPLVNVESFNQNQILEIPNKSFKLNYSADNFLKDTKDFVYHYNRDKKYKGFSLQSQDVGDSILALKDVLNDFARDTFLEDKKKGAKVRSIGYRHIDLLNQYMDSKISLFHIQILGDLNMSRSHKKQAILTNVQTIFSPNQLSNFYPYALNILHGLLHLNFPSMFRYSKEVHIEKTFTFDMKKSKKRIYHGPVIYLDKNRDILIVKTHFIDNLDDHTLGNKNFNNLISPDTIRDFDDFYSILSSKTRRIRYPKKYLSQYNLYGKTFLREHLENSLDSADDAKERGLLNMYKSGKHQSEEESYIIYNKEVNFSGQNTADRVANSSLSQLIYPAYITPKQYKNIYDNMVESDLAYYIFRRYMNTKDTLVQGPKILETEVHTESAVDLIVDSKNKSSNSIIHLPIRPSKKYKYFVFDVFMQVPSQIMDSMVSDHLAKNKIGGYSSFISSNRIKKINAISSLYNLAMISLEYAYELLFWVATMDIWGVVSDFSETLPLKYTDNIYPIFITPNIIMIIIVYPLLIATKIVILYLFYRYCYESVKSMAIHMLDHYLNEQEEQGGLPIHEETIHWIAKTFNLSFFLPYTIYTKFNISFADVVGMEDYVEKLEELFKVVGYKNVLYRLPGFFFRSIPEERKELKKQALFIPRQTHLMLTGIPGTGKTYLARALGGELKVPILVFSQAAIMGPIYNKIKVIFEKAYEMTPCIIFIDEIDAIAYARPHVDTGKKKRTLTIYSRFKPFYNFVLEQEGAFRDERLNMPLNAFIGYIGSSSIERDSINKMGLTPMEDLILNTPFYILQDFDANIAYRENLEPNRALLYRLLVECDGFAAKEEYELKISNWVFASLFKKGEGLGVIGATNRYKVLDPALLRPGRFYTKIKFNLPSEINRHILFFMKKATSARYSNDINWEYFLRATEGWTPAAITAVVDNCNLKSYINKNPVIDNQMINDSINYVLGVNFITADLEPFPSKEAEDKFLYIQATRIFFECVFKTAGVRDVFSRYPRRDTIDKSNYRRKIIKLSKINNYKSDFYEKKLLGFLGPQIGEMYYQIYHSKDSPLENPLHIQISASFGFEYAIIFISLMIDYWCLYPTETLLTNESLLSLRQDKKFSFEKGESVERATVAKITANRFDHPEFDHLDDFDYILAEELPNYFKYLKSKLEWSQNYGVKLSQSRYADIQSNFVITPIDIFGETYYFKFSKTIFLDFNSINENKIERYMFAILLQAFEMGYIILKQNQHIIKYFIEKLKTTEYMRIMDIEECFKKDDLKVIY